MLAYWNGDTQSIKFVSNGLDMAGIGRKNINRLIGYGILVFLIGFFTGTLWNKHLQWLILAGSFSTFAGIYFFFKETILIKEFEFDRRDGVLTYFWNTLALRTWTFIFALWMIVMVLELLINGYL